MADLTLLIGLDEKRFKFIQTDVHTYNVPVFNGDIHQFSLEVILMPTGDSEKLPRYAITPDSNIPNWMLQHNVAFKLNQHIKERGSG